MEKIILMKLGGSLLTDKSKAYTTRPQEIKRIVKEIKEALEEKKLNLVIGNGAGSFAHQSAKKYGTIDGFDDDNGKYGACFVENDAVKLNRILVEEFLRQRVSVMGMQPSAFLLAKNKEFYRGSFEIVEECIDKKIIPIVFGDVIIDTEKNSTIFSTDKILKILSQNLKYEVEKIILIGGYDGVLDSEGKLIDEISDLKDVEEHLSGSKEVDVTGGMRNKVIELLEVAKLGVKSYIVSGLKRGNIKNVLLEKDFLGTEIKK